jgi:hypothetical protein
MKRCVRNTPARKKPKPLLQFNTRTYMFRREKHVQKSLDKLFGVEKRGPVKFV